MSTYEPIASQTLGSAAASVTFSSIPQGYTDLVCILTGTASSNNSNTYLQFNGDTSSLYSATYLGGDGSTASSGRQSNQTKMLLDGPAYWNTAQGPNKIVNIQNYSNSTTFKTVLTRANSNLGTDALAGLYRSTNPITSVTFLIDSNYASGSTFSLYGIQVGDKAQKAQGGNIVTSDGTYVYHTFTSSGSFIPSQALTVDYLVVAGGGGGGGRAGGGGGAGGFRTSIGGTALSVTAKSYPVIVGAGGAGGGVPGNVGVTGMQGNNSVFSTITSTGGGGGAADNGTSTQAATTGGSGGGSGHLSNGAAGNAGSYSPVEGYAGGNNPTGNFNYYAGSGGGGSSAVGANGNSNVGGGNGGAGTANSITGSSVTYAGGGGGGCASGGANSTGGTGGGGAGKAGSAAGDAGTVNLGGGGGGGGVVQPGGAGGSGIVIIRYAI